MTNQQPSYGVSQPAYGLQPYGQPAYNQPAYNQPAYNQPMMNQPMMNQPMMNQPYQQPYPQDPGYYGQQQAPIIIQSWSLIYLLFYRLSFILNHNFNH